MSAPGSSGASLLSHLGDTLGTSEHALRLLLSILLGYPIVLIHRHFLYGRSPVLQHLLFICTGFLISSFCYGWDTFHLIGTVVGVYGILLLFGGSFLGAIATLVFTMTYLLYGYFATSTDVYDIKWTMPHCVLTLRLTGVAIDLYDGAQKQETLSAENKKSALQEKPSILELLAHSFFPSAFLVGPQFHMKRYQNFVSGKLIPNTNSSKLPNCVRPALIRFGTGTLYLCIYQVLTIWVPDMYPDTETFQQNGFLMKHVMLGLWARTALYKYISCWLITEGVCIMSGITYSGKDENNIEKWDGCANVQLSVFEGCTKFNHYIMAFNTNTNHWIAQYVYKRLKFLNSKLASQGGALAFLAVWHGFHSGYYVCFFNEFVVMLMEKEVESILARNEKATMFLSSPFVSPIVWVILKLYTFIFMGYCLVPFVLLSFNRYWAVYKSVYFSGYLLFLGWHLYAPLVRKALKPSRARNAHQD
ncbi:lysophospholipid acyltransferase 5 [Frankliniella occidentalis]|uniref:Lysophospholipid acyltransferase 5 n=1 Tax=Frankliniella occidentalis TaxID=133901 RepID=A0A6J1RZF4_FRAOC|nr:lysophospholipid acyltransferase 5 [Frankliniella occidentalis]